MNFETKWTKEEKLIITIDCGTTYSGVAYAYLLPQGLVSVKRVLDWPGQGGQGEAKIPTIIWYDRNQTPRLLGAEASAIEATDGEEQGWELAQNFKLHLHPPTMQTRNPFSLDPLPFQIGIEKIYADFFRYVYNHTENYFKGHELQGATIWQNLAQKKKIEFVIAHPNGWTLYEQEFLRKAAVNGGLTSSVDAPNKVHMITEAEASVHYVVFHGGTENRLQHGVDFIVCDAGGSTVDTTLYTVTGMFPELELKEKRGSACVQAGGMFVNKAAKTYIARQFLRSEVAKSDADPITEIMAKFETKKKNFDDSDEVKIRVGMSRMNIPFLNVSRGLLTLKRSELATFFSGPVQEIIASVREQMRGHPRVAYLMLVGGFGDSPHLRRELKKAFGNRVEFLLANESGAKAVADGAAAWYIRQSVKGRATRFTYGIEIRVPYEVSRHDGRKVFKDNSSDYVQGVWSAIVHKDVTVEYNEKWRSPFSQCYDTANPHLAAFTVDLITYTGDSTAPYFVMDATGDLEYGFMKACEIRADLSGMAGSLERHTGPRGPYWTLPFEVGILFGSNELSAALFWKDSNGRECEGPVAIIPRQFT